MIKCPVCGNTGDIIIVCETLYWCPCGHHWSEPPSGIAIMDIEIVAAFTCHAGRNITIRLTKGVHKLSEKPMSERQKRLSWSTGYVMLSRGASVIS